MQGLKVPFTADGSEFKKGLDKMRSDTKSFSTSIKSELAKAFSFGLLISGLKSVLEQMGRIDDLSKRFGVSAESIQRVGTAAKLAGSDLEGVAKAMSVVTKNSYEAAVNGGSMADAFNSLGIDASKFVNMLKKLVGKELLTRSPPSQKHQATST